MSYFAEVKDGTVQRVLAVDQDFINTHQDKLGDASNWVQTSFTHSIRKQFAGVGFTYDSVNDVFVRPQPFPSWTLDENHDWQAPVVYPDDGNNYAWNEAAQEWDVITGP